jgi:Glycosyl transferases group 1
MSRRQNGTFYVCHVTHSHDRTYAENICEYFEQVGVRYDIVEFETAGQRPELRRCLDGDTIAILGFNSQLDHCWLGDENFVVAAAKKNVPVIHWFLDHPSTWWPEFTHATVGNSRFLFVSEFCERYFERYCLATACTAWTANIGPNWRSRVAELSRRDFLARDIGCLIPLNLKRIGGTVADTRSRLRTLEPGVCEAVEEAIERARFDLTGPLEAHLAATLARHNRDLANGEFHHCFQIMDETIQIWRRLKIFEVASKFPVLIQTDATPVSILRGAAATFSDDPGTNSGPATTARMKSCRSVLTANFANDMLHERTLNGLNAGCVVLVEDSPAHRPLFSHGKNALFFRYDDDSLAQCLDLVCNRPERAYEIAQAGFALRDDPAVRFGGFNNILELARP